MSRTYKSILVILVILIIDQVSKYIVKTNMMLGEEIAVFGDWFIIHFTENDGMAFGWDIPGSSGKLILTLFRIVAVIGIGFYLRFLIRQEAHQGLIICISLILAGAIGNIVDSIFYGVIFNESLYQVAELFPEEGGYGTLMHGRVVDMFYFRPVFNIADSSISVGVILILIFQKQFFKDLQ